MAHDEGAELAERPLPADRLPGDRLLLGAQVPKDGPRASTRSTRSSSRPTRSSASRCDEREKLAGVAVDAVFDSVSVATTFREKLAEVGVIFCSFSEAVQSHPDLVKRYLGSVVPYTDNFFATLNSAVFSDGSFVYVPKGVRCPMELSTYFRINADKTGQFERTLIIADEGALRQLPGGLHRPHARREPAPRGGRGARRPGRRGDQVLDGPELVPRRRGGQGGIYNFVTKRGKCLGKRSKISWTQVETGSAITWKYPSCILQGDNSVGEFYSVAVTNNYQQADTGTKMIHIGKNTRARSSRRASPPATARTPTAAS